MSDFYFVNISWNICSDFFINKTWAKYKNNIFVLIYLMFIFNCSQYFTILKKLVQKKGNFYFGNSKEKINWNWIVEVVQQL